MSKARHKSRLTVERVRKFRYEPKGPRIQRLWDEEISGLAVEAFATGRKSWILRYRVHGKQRIMTLGDAKRLIHLATARQKATEVLLKVMQGRDPLLEKRFDMSADTLAECFHALKSRPEFETKSDNTKRGLESSFRNHIEKPLGHIPITSITRRMIAGVIDSLIGEGKHGAAKAALACVQKVTAFASSRHLIEDNPALNSKLVFNLVKCERTLTDEEIRKLWDLGDSPQAGCIRWLIATGSRITEALSLQWSHFEGDVLSIPETVTKARRAYKLPLTDLMRHILAERKAAQHRFSRYVFSSGNRPVSSHTVRAKVKESGLQDVFPHVFRHHFVTKLKDLSRSPETVIRLVNHKVPGITEGVYTHGDFLSAKAEVLNIWHDHLIEVLGLDLSKTEAKSG